MIANLHLQGTGGAVCIVMGLYLIWLGLHKLRTWPRARGEVVSITKVNGMPVPEVEFTSADGVKRKFLSKMAYRQRLRIGDTVDLLYNPETPDEAERVSLMSAVFAPLMFAVFGASQFFCGFWSCK